MVMGFTTRYSGTFRFIQARWPTYLFGYGGGLLFCLVIMWISIQQGWFAFVNITLAGAIILLYFSGASLWAAHKLFDGSKIIDALFEVGRFSQDQTIVHIDQGLRSTGIALGERLSSGRVIVIDVYNPQMFPSRWLSRAAHQAARPLNEPRIIWKSGSIDLLPQPDQSVSAVALSLTVTELWQEGDRICLLEEIFRILSPTGVLVIAERIRTPTSWMTMGPAAIRLRSVSYWRQILADVGFHIEKELVCDDLLLIIRAKSRNEEKMNTVAS
jgi:SAM-dependent methyltransferase